MDNQKSNTSVIVSFIIVVAVVGLGVYALMHKSPEMNEDLPLLPEGNTSISDTANNQTEVSDQAPGAKNETSVKTMNQTAKNGDILVMNYTGRLENGTVFDSNVDPKFNHVQPFEFTLGAGQVIKGWDEGLLGMKVGEKKTLTISPEKGYGASGQGPIPPNSTLIFDVELVAIK